MGLEGSRWGLQGGRVVSQGVDVYVMMGGGGVGQHRVQDPSSAIEGSHELKLRSIPRFPSNILLPFYFLGSLTKTK